MQIKLEDSIKEIEKDQIKNGLQTYLSDIDFILDTLDIEKQTQSSLDFLTILNSMIAILTTIISFFMLLIALIKNIKDNVWELGILRSIGLDHKQIHLIYFIETFAVIFSALILGTVVGWIISFISSIYLQIFLELPRNLYFPWIEFCILVGALTITSILTTFLGLLGVVYQPIAKILKGLV